MISWVIILKTVAFEIFINLYSYKCLHFLNVKTGNFRVIFHYVYGMIVM